jgi:uncharacterized protein YjgD (DUF1641 family)
MTTTHPVAADTTTHEVALDARLAAMEGQLDRLVAAAEQRESELEPLRDLAAEVGMLALPVTEAVTVAVGDLEERGYVAFARGSASIVDRIVTSFTEDDVAALGDNVVLILETLKEMTQPEVMQLLRRTALAARAQQTDEASTPPSTFALLGQLRDPEVRRGLARLLDLLRTVGSDGDAAGSSVPHDHPTRSHRR